MIQAFCDGSITGWAWAKAGQKDSLPHAWSGWLVKDYNGHVFKWQSIDLGEGAHMSANVAEYFAVRSALKWIGDSIWKKNDVEVVSDSQTVIRQLTGRYNAYDPKIILLRDECRRLASYIGGAVTYRWVRREENRHADVLSKALQIWGRQPTWDEVEGRLVKKPSGRVKKSDRR